MILEGGSNPPGASKPHFLSAADHAAVYCTIGSELQVTVMGSQRWKPPHFSIDVWKKRR
jgi:hypothetical protein